ncbi:hypothetical protein ARTHRO9V_230040 [Arthrobacter sp. 9V]|nr:hypothetical protein ARTHRO9V_230040 [Arthrobacter sp. 9V]
MFSPNMGVICQLEAWLALASVDNLSATAENVQNEECAG